MKALLAVVLALPATAQGADPGASEAALACVASYSAKPELLDVDEGRWKRLCLKFGSPDAIASLAELASPCLETAEGLQPHLKEKAVDRCWGLLPDGGGGGGGGAAPDEPVPSDPDADEDALPLGHVGSQVGAALESGDIAGLYGEKSGDGTVDLSFKPPKKAPVGSAQTPSIKYILVDSPDPFGATGSSPPPPPFFENPEPARGTAPDTVPSCGQARPEPSGGSNAGLYASLEAGVACVPIPALRDPLLHYLKVLGLRGYDNADSVGGKNAGLNRFFESLSLNDPEFRGKVRAFYERVREVDNRMPATKKPTLADAAGKGAFEDVPPGWAWEAALKTAGGDPNTAMRLIGFCGHDDVSQSRLVSPRSSEEAVEAMEASRRGMTARIAEIERRLGSAGEPLEAPPDGGIAVATLGGDEPPSFLRWQLGDLREKLATLSPDGFATKAEHVCPSSRSALYAPGSLAASAVLPDALRERVAKVQAPKMGPTALPAKHYHVLGSAAAACELVRKGAPGWFARMVQPNAAWAYRTLRIDERAQGALNQREQFKAEYSELVANLGDRAPDFESFVAAKFVAAAPADALAGAETPPELKKARVELSYMDAFTLMEDRGYGGHKVFGKRIPFSTARIDWPWKLLSSGVPSGWSPERAAEAERRLETFLVDSEWTTAQHTAGAAFAASHCRPEGAAVASALPPIPEGTP